MTRTTTPARRPNHAEDAVGTAPPAIARAPGEDDDDRREEERRGRATAARTGAARRGGGPPVARANEVASGARRDIAAACIGVGGAAGGTRARECARRATHVGGFGQSSFLVFGSDPSVTV
jgi:hypothetical protein